MSLFKCREWWATKCGQSEEFDSGSLVVANVDNEYDGFLKIVTGSLEGILRIFQPHGKEFRVEDQLLEVELEAPILQMSFGQFSSAEGKQLAVLHPRKLVVYQVIAVGQAGATSYLELKKLYEHYLEHTAANFCYGKFGSNYYECICVQSCDGQLSFFEQESFAFSRFLPNFLLPGPICYVSAIDSFVTCNSAFEVECYKFSNLAAKQDSGPTNEDKPNKKLKPDWSVVIGENAVQICPARFTSQLGPENSDIVVVAEHTLFVLKEDGEFKMQKRLEYHPSTCLSYPTKIYNNNINNNNNNDTNKQNLAVTTHSSALVVYDDVRLVWSARTPFVVVAIGIGEFGGVGGMLVSLSDEGDLAVTYMGTDPPKHVSTSVEDIDYEAMEKEHRKLMRAIKDSSVESKVEPKDKLTLRAQIPSHLDNLQQTHHDDTTMDDILYQQQQNQQQQYQSNLYNNQQKSLTVKLFVSYSGGSNIRDVKICASTTSQLGLFEDSIVIPQISANPGTPIIVNFTFYRQQSSKQVPPSNKASFVATYNTKGGKSRCAQHEINLPLCLFCDLISPVKNSNFKLTIDINFTPPQLLELFEDLANQSDLINDFQIQQQLMNVMSFQYQSGHDVTIVVAKSSNKFRIQSDTFESIWLVLQELIFRLKNYFIDEPGLQISYNEPIPLQDYFDIIDRHFETRGHVRLLEETLDKRACQMRSVQKRLLVRFKDRNPEALEHLELLMETTYDQLVTLADDMEAAQKQLLQYSQSLSAATQLVLLLVKYRFGLDEKSFQVLKNHLPPQVNDVSDYGWQEETDALMTQLLRTCLARNAKERNAALPPLQNTQSTEKLKKHIALVLERLSKVGSLSINEEQNQETNS